MELSIVKETCPNDIADADASILLLDTPENLGIDFLQLVQKQGMKFNSERVNDQEALFSALKKGKWDLLLVCDQVSVPAPEEIITFMDQLRCETGFVLLSKSEVTIDLLTKAYRQGISAVVSSQHPDYSLEVFVRAVERSRRNFQLSQLNQEKFDLRKHCEELVSGTEEALAYLQDGIHVFGNNAYLQLFGYSSLDDLLITPFIDIVSTEFQEKIKNKLLEFQHSLRVKSETPNLEITELFVQGSGQKEGILQVSAVFKPAIHEGEECIQVIVKDNAAKQGRGESSAALEGLGYPIFINHLDNFVAEARNADKHLGYVVHIQGSGFEHYIALKGFGSLNGKLKGLASELKASLSKQDLLIRFSEHSFLILLKDADNSVPEEDKAIIAISTLLSKVQTVLNKEINSESDEKVCFSHNVVSVDGMSSPAETLIKEFLQGESKASVNKQNTEHKTDNVIQFNDKPGVAEPGLDAVNPQNISKDGKSRPHSETEQRQQEGSNSAQIDDSNEVLQPDAKPGKKAVSKSVLYTESQLNEALSADSFSLFYETVISVLDIETEFYDIALHLKDVKNKVTRNHLDESVCNSPLSGKLDMWVLQNAVKVISALYQQGQEYRLILPFSARSLTENKLPEMLKKEMGTFGLPEGMIVLEFSIHDLNKDAADSISRLQKLSEAGVLLCVSDVFDIRELENISGSGVISMVKLEKSLIEKSLSDKKHFNFLGNSIEKLHDKKIRVIAGDISTNELLNICCKAKVDLVNGKYIQKNPLQLNEDSLAQEMVI